MTVSVPSAGDSADYTWGAAVAAIVNAILPISLAADVLTNSASFADLATAPVEAGKVYTGQLTIRWQPSATSMGAGIGINTPGGTLLMYQDHMLGSAGTVESTDRVTAVDTGGPSSAGNTNARLSKLHLVYACSVSGNLAIRGRRNGTSGTGITFYKGSGGLLIVT